MGHRADFLVARVVRHGRENPTKRDPSVINEAGPRYHLFLRPEQRSGAYLVFSVAPAMLTDSSETATHHGVVPGR